MVRHDFAPQDDGNSHDNHNGDDERGRRSKQPTPDVAQDELKESSLAPSGPSALSPKPHDQDQDDTDSLVNDPEPNNRTDMPPRPQTPDHSTTQMPPPRLTPRQQVANAEFTPAMRGNNAALVHSSPKLSVPTVEHGSSRLSSPNNGNTGSSNPRKRARNSSASSQERATISPKVHRRRDDQVSSPQLSSSSLAVQPPINITTNTTAPASDEDASDDDEDDAIPPTRPTSNPNPPLTPPKRLSEMSTQALRTLYHSRRDELVSIYGALHLVPEHYRLQMREFVDELKGRGEKREKRKKSETQKRVVEGEEQDGGEGVEASGGGNGSGTELEMPKFLGNSVLGGKKSMGMAPIAPMLHSKKESGGAARRGGE